MSRLSIDEQIEVTLNEIQVYNNEKIPLLRELSRNPSDDVEAALARNASALKKSQERLALLKEAVEQEAKNGPIVSAEELADAKDAAKELLNAHAYLQTKIRDVFTAISEQAESSDEFTGIASRVYIHLARLKKLSGRGKKHESFHSVGSGIRDIGMELTAREAIAQIPFVTNADKVYSLPRHREQVESYVAAQLNEIEKLAAGQVEGVPEVNDTAEVV